VVVMPLLGMVDEVGGVEVHWAHYFDVVCWRVVLGKVLCHVGGSSFPVDGVLLPLPDSVF
jgi:hypothetical protein